MHYARHGHLEMKYNWKDIVVDTAIAAVVFGVVALMVGSFGDQEPVFPCFHC